MKWIQGVSNGMRLVGPPGGEVIAEILDIHNVKAGALIASAPEMLEALKVCVAAYRNADIVPNALEMAEAAIKKATI